MKKENKLPVRHATCSYRGSGNPTTMNLTVNNETPILNPTWTTPELEEIPLSCEIATYSMAELSDDLTR